MWLPFTSGSTFGLHPDTNEVRMGDVLCAYVRAGGRAGGRASIRKADIMCICDAKH